MGHQVLRLSELQGLFLGPASIGIKVTRKVLYVIWQLMWSPKEVSIPTHHIKKVRWGEVSSYVYRSGENHPEIVASHHRVMGNPFHYYGQR